MQVTVRKGTVEDYLCRRGIDDVKNNWDYMVNLASKCQGDEVLLIEFQTLDEALSCQKPPKIISYATTGLQTLQQSYIERLRRENKFILGLSIVEMDVYIWIDFPKDKVDRL